jgi:hypothetical protein
LNSTDDFNNGWKRYYHIKANEITSNGTLQNGMSKHNPYLSVPDASGNFIIPGIPFNSCYVREGVNTSNEISFNHSYLESPRINTDFNGVSLPAGDIYELKTNVYNPNADDLQNGFLNLDINLTSGDNTTTASYLPVNGKDYVDGTTYGLNRGESIFTTFNQAIKWNTKNAYSTTLTTSNYFTMPNLPEQYGGFHIQIGPGNADQDFTRMDSHNPNSVGGTILDPYFDGKRFIINSYYDDLNDQSVGGGMGGSGLNVIRTGDNIPMNFGVGYPWRMMHQFYNEMEPGLLTNGISYNKWWTYLGGGSGGNQFSNIPTLADANVKLKKVELIRHTKNPYMLKSVEYHKASDENTDAADTEGYGWTLISKKQFTYEIGQVERFVTVQKSDGTFKTFPKNNNRNIVLLTSIQQLPGILPPNFNITKTPTTHFEYNEENFVTLSGTVYTANIFNGTSNKANTNYVLLTGVTDQLGNKTIIEYGTTYSVQQYRQRFATQSTGWTWKKINGYNAIVYGC